MLSYMTNASALPATRADRDVDKIIGTNVRILMWSRDETQTFVAPLLGIDQTSLSLKLRGKRPWYAAEILAVAQRYGVSIGSLFKLPEVDSNHQPAGIKPAAETHDAIITKLRPSDRPIIDKPHLARVSRLRVNG